MIRRSWYLCGSVHIGSSLQQLLDDVQVALLGAEVQGIQAVLWRKETRSKGVSNSDWKQRLQFTHYNFAKVIVQDMTAICTCQYLHIAASLSRMCLMVGLHNCFCLKLKMGISGQTARSQFDYTIYASSVFSPPCSW